MATKKTDNHYTGDKVALRTDHSPWSDKELNVLDCFGGHGIIWRAIQRKTENKINRVAIDQRKDMLQMHLHGDNVKVMKSMDLSKFDVIDLDAYGIPYEQLKIVFDKNFKGTVFVTAIQTMTGNMPHGLLQEIGFSKEMIEKSPSLFARRGFQYLLEWLAIKGVTKIMHRSKNRKHYFTFDIVDDEADCDNLQANTFANLS